MDANKILVSKKEPFGYSDNDVIRPLCIMLPQIMLNVLIVIKQCLKVSDKKLLKKYIKIWEKISSLVGKKFDSERAYGDSDKYAKTKIKSYGGNVNTNFQG